MFTQKQWIAQGLIIVDEDNVLIADARMHGDSQLWSDNHGRPYNELIANAQLIAAAPDMYKALKFLSEHIDQSLTTSGLRYLKAYVDKTLAKAEGK